MSDSQHSDLHNLPTKKQYRVLEIIYSYAREHGTAPTLDELAHALGLANASGAHFHVRALIQAGLVTTGHTETAAALHSPARTLRLTGHGQKVVTRLQRLYSSTLLCGDRDLMLTESEYAVAQSLILPAATLSRRYRGDRIVLRFPNTAERNYWADLLLERLGVDS